MLIRIVTISASLHQDSEKQKIVAFQSIPCWTPAPLIQANIPPGSLLFWVGDLGKYKVLVVRFPFIPLNVFPVDQCSYSVCWDIAVFNKLFTVIFCDSTKLKSEGSVLPSYLTAR